MNPTDELPTDGSNPIICEDIAHWSDKKIYEAQRRGENQRKNYSAIIRWPFIRWA